MLLLSGSKTLMVGSVRADLNPWGCKYLCKLD